MRARVDQLLGDEESWQRMSAAGKKLVNGRGVERVVEVLGQLNEPIVVEATGIWQDSHYTDGG
jgi:hypothetical protein